MWQFLAGLGIGSMLSSGNGSNGNDNGGCGCGCLSLIFWVVVICLIVGSCSAVGQST